LALVPPSPNPVAARPHDLAHWLAQGHAAATAAAEATPAAALADYSTRRPPAAPLFEAPGLSMELSGASPLGGSNRNSSPNSGGFSLADLAASDLFY
jgi:hypothetical protein